MKKFMLATIIAVAMLFASCCNYVWVPVPMPDKEPEHVHTYETIIDATGDDMYQVVRCSECGEELSRTPYTGKTVTAADGTEYKTIEEAITAFASEAAGEHTLTIANGDYAVGPMSLNQTVAGRKLTIKAETAGAVTIKAKDPSTTALITVDSESSYQDGADVLIQGIDFDLTNASGTQAAIAMGTGKNRYAQNVTVDGCNFVGLNDQSFAVQVNANAGAKNITIQNCTGDNIRALCANYGTNIIIKDCVLTNSKSIINSSSTNAIPASSDEYTVQLIGITADIKANVPDKIYAIRLSGGRTLIENCDITMTYNNTFAADHEDATDYGLLVLRDADNVVDIKNSTLTTNTVSGSTYYAYAVYQEPDEIETTINADDASTLTGGVYPDTLTIN